MQNNSLVLYAPQTITTADGQTFELPTGGIASLVPVGGGSLSNIWRLVAGQPRDGRFKDGSNEFYLTRKVKDQKSGDYISENVRLGAAELRVVPLDYVWSRSMFSKPFNEGDKPLCGSTDYMTPDLKYRGGTLPMGDAIAMIDQCAAIEVKRDAAGNIVSQRVKEICPFAKWTKGKDGKNVPPPCTPQYIVLVAVQIPDGDLVLAELNHKVSSAKFGMKISNQIAGLKTLGRPVYQHPVDLRIVEAGQGNSFESVLRLDIVNEFTPDEEMTLDELLAEVETHKQNRIENSKYVPDRENESPVATSSVVTIEEPAAIAAPKNGNGNGKKKAMI